MGRRPGAAQGRRVLPQALHRRRVPSPTGEGTGEKGVCACLGKREGGVGGVGGVESYHALLSKTPMSEMSRVANTLHFGFLAVTLSFPTSCFPKLYISRARELRSLALLSSPEMPKVC